MCARVPRGSVHSAFVHLWMKRHRSEHGTKIHDLSFDDVVGFLRSNKAKLTCDQLMVLSQEIDNLYASQASMVTQEVMILDFLLLIGLQFPPELWLQIFKRVPFAQITAASSAEDFKFWIGCRTVSKSWNAWVQKIDFSTKLPSVDLLAVQGMNLSNILSRFQFSHIGLSFSSVNDVKLLSRATRLALFHEKAIPADQKHLVSQLTQLTDLTDHHCFTAQEHLLALTNLKTLWLNDAPHITTLQTLTKLECLTLFHPFSLTQESLNDLTKITQLTTDRPEFFRFGKGVCNGNYHYVGEWLDGKRHGYGRNYDGDDYDGDWFDDERHGKGVLSFGGKKKSNYNGEWVRGQRTGKGLRTFECEDTYDGCWVDGKRSGYGVYRRHHSHVYEGNWLNGRCHGPGRCEYENGDVFEGTWINGVRSGRGVYRYSNGEVLDSTWPNGATDVSWVAVDTEDEETESDSEN